MVAGETGGVEGVGESLAVSVMVEVMGGGLFSGGMRDATGQAVYRSCLDFPDLYHFLQIPESWQTSSQCSSIVSERALTACKHVVTCA